MKTTNLNFMFLGALLLTFLCFASCQKDSTLENVETTIEHTEPNSPTARHCSGASSYDGTGECWCYIPVFMDCTGQLHAGSTAFSAESCSYQLEQIMNEFKEENPYCHAVEAQISCIKSQCPTPN